MPLGYLLLLLAVLLALEESLLDDEESQATVFVEGFDVKNVIVGCQAVAVGNKSAKAALPWTNNIIMSIFIWWFTTNPFSLVTGWVGWICVRVHG